MINHKHKFIFIHIPKTAGTSIEKTFNSFKKKKKKCLYGEQNGVVLQHLRAPEIHKMVGNEIFKNYFKFSVVRNPFSRCVSEYFWYKRRKSNVLSFKQWVNTKLQDLIENSTRIDNKYPKKLKMHNLEQFKFVYNELNESMVDYICKFENLQQDFNIVCDKIGIPRQQLPHLNKTNHKHYTEYYDDETREIVAEKYARDIEYFGYEFGE